MLKLHPKVQAASIAKTASISNGSGGMEVGSSSGKGVLCLFLITARGGSSIFPDSKVLNHTKK